MAMTSAQLAFSVFIILACVPGAHHVSSITPDAHTHARMRARMLAHAVMRS